MKKRSSQLINCLAPECGENCSDYRVNDQPQHEVIAEYTVMHETDGREPARPNGVACRWLAGTWSGKTFQCHLRRLDGNENKEHNRCKEMCHENQIERNDIG